MKNLGTRTMRIVALIAILALQVPLISNLGSASAASPSSLYTFDFRNTNGSLPNLAASNTTAPMTLVGSWVSDSSGTQFSGDKVSTSSVGYAKPIAGSTISATASESVGATALYTYTGGCPTDSQNISQIGSFATNVSQVKLQISKCRSGLVYPECRIAGSLTPQTAYAVRGTTPIQANTTYRQTCTKSPDTATSSTLVMELVRISQNGNQTFSNSFTIPRTGSIQSTSHLSVANKYPLPSQTNNTDQFSSKVVRVSYCKAANLADAQTCLSEEVPAVVTTPPDPNPASVDEVKYSFGNSPEEVVFSWRGAENTIYYGLTTSLGSQAVASLSAITPVDIAGPFMEARLQGLTPGATYFYKIGSSGEQYTFTSSPANRQSFKAISIGDTIVESCRSYQAQMNQLVLAKNANFMLHGGDISIANECGNHAVHEFYSNIEPFTRSKAFMPVWGNHEYGSPTANSPAGTVRDSLDNYKGRSAIPNPQTVPNDTATQTSHPGCGQASGSTVNTCRGEDWGWFRSGSVLFISFPEPWPGAITDWQTKVTPLMQSAQTDPTVDYIVTYGHRPIYSSTSWTPGTSYESVFTTLSNTFGPNAGGKYVLNITQHRHNMEVFESMSGGVMHVVNGGGGQGLLGFQSILPGSTFRAKRLGFSTLEYDGVSRQLVFKMICGPSTSGETLSCTPGSEIYSKTFSAYTN
jgi:hypothetical protein